MVKKVMHWIYISPHLDDVALSCGGLVWEQTQAGDQASIWTICAGDPPPGPLSAFARSLHTRWGNDRAAISERRVEDITSCGRLGASFKHFQVPDCIYRQRILSPDNPATSPEFLYPNEGSLFGSLHPADETLITALENKLREALPSECELVCPLGLGNHVDHQLTIEAVKRTGRQPWFYGEYPYILQNTHIIDDMIRSGWVRRLFHISRDGLIAWGDSVAAHRSQISTFWPDLSRMKTSLHSYLGQNDGIVLWKSH